MHIDVIRHAGCILHATDRQPAQAYQLFGNNLGGKKQPCIKYEHLGLGATTIHENSSEPLQSTISHQCGLEQSPGHLALSRWTPSASSPLQHIRILVPV